MSDEQLIKGFSVKDQAYLIVVGLTGSWMYDATRAQLKDEVYCKEIVEQYWANYGDQSLSEIAMYCSDIMEKCPYCDNLVLHTVSNCECEASKRKDEVEDPKHRALVEKAMNLLHEVISYEFNDSRLAKIADELSNYCEQTDNITAEAVKPKGYKGNRT